MADEGFHEFQLSGKHLVALFMGATVVAVVIFLCGVAVGRGVLVKRTAEAAQRAEEAIEDPTAAPPAVTDPTSVATQGDSEKPADELIYHDVLTDKKQAPEALKPATTSEPPREATPPPPPPRSEEPAPAEPAAPSAPGEPSGNGFAVQVAAVRERGEANTIARRLTAKGYSAFVMAPASGAPRVFRVRVGKFKDRREAERVAAKLRKEEQFKPWITR